MKKNLLLTSLLLLLYTFNHAVAENWTAFWDEEQYKRGFKDENGKVKIPPTFMGMTQATQFKNIIAVMEEKNGQYDSYYLLKSGDRIENVNMYTFDNSFDCESDNKIRFRDQSTDNMGYLDGQGNVAIPPIYNTGQPFANGLASVIQGATLMCMNGKPFSTNNRCEHPHWTGGESLVINAKNQVLLKEHSLGQEIDRYSVTITETPIKKYSVESLQGIDGRHYNFINIEKHFERWFRESILSDLDLTSLLKHSFSEITLFDPKTGWYKQPKKDFWGNNYNTVVAALRLLLEDDASFFVTMDNLNALIYKEKKYQLFYAECYNIYSNKHPVLSIISNHKHELSSVQNTYSFLKTANGYKLISMTVRTANLH